jgi:hypothetical protein
MRRTDSIDFVFQLASLVVALIIVHAFYVTVVRPRANAFSAEQAALMAADSEYVQQRSVWVIVRDFEQEACFVLMLWAMAIMASKGLTTARESQLLEADLVHCDDLVRPEASRMPPTPPAALPKPKPSDSTPSFRWCGTSPGQFHPSDSSAPFAVLGQPSARRTVQSRATSPG